jgi:NAD+ kinase
MSSKLSFKRVGVFSQLHRPSIVSTLNNLLRYLEKKEVRVLLETTTAKLAKSFGGEAVFAKKMVKQSDLLITIGGDGSLLQAARIAILEDIPLVGINQGRVGFLTDISPTELSEKLDEIFSGQFKEEQRLGLSVTYRGGSPKKKAKQPCVAVNEILFASDHVARMVEYEIYIDEEFLCKQRSNGMLISTSTGSTAYAMSAGGPILQAGLNAMVLVPVCPHHLNNRPIIIDSDQKVTIQLNMTSKSDASIYGDSQLCFHVHRDMAVEVQTFSKPLRLIHPTDHNYFETLRRKLNWG